MASPLKKKRRTERYEINRSPLSNGLTKRKLAELVRVPLHELNGLVKYKSAFVTEREAFSGDKMRPLAYPTGRLRTVNEKLLFQLKKIRLPSYVKSPRKGISQRHNALDHLDARQVLKVDIVKFYPSMGRERVARFFREEFGMYPDVAGLITELVTSEGKVFYGSPITPLLVFLINQRMFDEIHSACARYGLPMTLWVDNITISGSAVPGELLREIREIIRLHGFRSHDIEYKNTNRVVPVTGVGVRRGELLPSNSLNLQIRDLQNDLRRAKTIDEYDDLSKMLLSKLGTVKYIYGSSSDRGRKVSMRMNSLRQKRRSRLKSA